MTEKEIKKLVIPFLFEKEFILEIIDKNDTFYVFTTFQNPALKIRKGTVGGPGPIVIDKNSKKAKRIHYLEIESNLFGKPKQRNNQQIILEIIERGYIYENDIFDFLLNEYGENLTKDYSIEMMSQDFIVLQFKNDYIYNLFCNFFSKIGVKVEIGEDLKLTIDRELK